MILYLINYIGLIIIQGRPGFWGIQYIWVFNFRYTVFLCLKLGIKYAPTINFGYKVYRVFLNLVFYTSFSVIFGRVISGILVFHYPLPPMANPDYSLKIFRYF